MLTIFTAVVQRGRKGFLAMEIELRNGVELENGGEGRMVCDGEGGNTVVSRFVVFPGERRRTSIDVREATCMITGWGNGVRPRHHDDKVVMVGRRQLDMGAKWLRFHGCAGGLANKGAVRNNGLGRGWWLQ
ncbi:aminomethyl transferase family protein [Sesbania bispinosa]|nr:aminomethyl transferase family protein [Sesbania bispinosa]